MRFNEDVNVHFSELLNIVNLIELKCNEVSKLNYQQTLYFFNGIATTHSLNLYQFNIFAPPVNIEVPTLLYPNKSIQGIAKVPKAPGGHPNEKGHLEISKYLLNEIEFAILT